VGAPSSSQTRGERERGGKGSRVEDDVIPPEKAMSHLHRVYWSYIPESRQQRKETAQPWSNQGSHGGEMWRQTKPDLRSARMC